MAKLTNDKENLVSLVTYLTREEANTIESRLQAAKIPYVMKGFDAASRYSSLYFEILVNLTDLQRSKVIVAYEQSKAVLRQKECPKCQSPNYTELPARTWWQKIYYAGTTRVKCNRCRTVFPI